MNIYLAIPYKGMEEESFKVANIIAAKLMKKGHYVFSPISHTHPIMLIGNLPTNWNYWQRYDKTFIEWCDELHVVILKKEGMIKICKSIGVQSEMSMAAKLNKVIKYINE